jgi:2-polyprenyl-3-methyl-5-hydroxy-6-metoxy-1,4-benzoquinol methylase
MFSLFCLFFRMFCVYIGRFLRLKLIRVRYNLFVPRSFYYLYFVKRCLVSESMARKTVQEYFSTLESRIGYGLLLGGTRHFGYYESTWWPFPIGKALKAIEVKLFTQLDLEKGATVLDAGAGFGHVAGYMARTGLFVKGIDIVDWHIERARQHIRSQHIEDLVDILDMSYEDMSSKLPHSTERT